MALAHIFPSIPSSYCLLCLIYSNRFNNNFLKDSSIHKGFARDTIASGADGIRNISRASIGSHSIQITANLITYKACRWRLNAIGVDARTRIPTNTPMSGGSASTRTLTLEIPVTCYQLIGIPDQSEKDEIVKSVMVLKAAEVEEGYSVDALASRQEILVDVRDKLLFEPEYAGNIKDNIPPKSSIRIPWAWLPGALCLLQEVGEVKLVLAIGVAAVQHLDAKPYIHDLLLSMALAECAAAKIGFEKNMISQGFEALARAQCLLRSKKSLGKLTLLSQIEESLEELAPACTLELLGMPHSPENAERRQGAIAALRELLRQGLDVETSCQVQDWPSFLSQALSRLMATEIVDILPWEDLALVRKNKKSIESQNQKVVIDFNCFYMALMAHLALGFSSRQTELITKAKTICECLVVSEAVDLKLEEYFCLFLLGQGKEAEVVEKLQQREVHLNPAAHSAISGKELKDASISNQSLEMWLKDAVLGAFPDTCNCPLTLVSFFSGLKKSDGSSKSKRPPQTMIGASNRPLSSSLVSEQRDFEGTLSRVNSSQHVGMVIRQLAPTDSRSPLVMHKNESGTKTNASSVQLKRNLGLQHTNFWDGWLVQGNLVIGITFLVVTGCIVFLTLKLSGLRVSKMSNASLLPVEKDMQHRSSLVYKTDMPTDSYVEPAYIKGNGIPGRLRKLLVMLMKQFRSLSDAGSLQLLCPATSLSSSTTVVYRRLMSIEEAEGLVKKWQSIKAKALGPNNQVHCLSEILDEVMLAQWQTLADAANAKPCFWRFVLLQLSVQRAEVLLDENGVTSAEIEALLEEAAELVDESVPNYPNYYSTYKVRYVLKMQADGSWRFSECELLSTS